MKKIVILMALFAFAAILSCEKKELQNVEEDDLGAIRLQLLSPDGQASQAECKSRFPDDLESIVSGIAVAVYRYDDEMEGWSLLTERFFRSFDDAKGFGFKLNRAFRYRLFAVANMWKGPGTGEDDFYSFPLDMKDLTDGVFVLGQGGNMSFSDVGVRGIPASGSSGELSFSETSRIDCAISMSRLFSKIVFNVDRQGYTGLYADPTRYFSDFRIIVSHLNAEICPFPSGTYEMGFTDCGETEHELTCAGKLLKNSYVFYVPANMHNLENSRCKVSAERLSKRGAKPDGPTDGEPEDDIEPCLTKLTFRGEFKPDSGYSGVADYSLYPGGSLTPYSIGAQWYRDFDLKPGCRYDLSLYFSLSTLMNRLQPYWQIDLLEFEDCRYFGLRWAQSRESGARHLIRGSWHGDNTVDGSAVQLVVARPELPAELGLWFSTEGREGSKNNDFDLLPSERKAGCPTLGGPSFASCNLMDNCFYISLRDKTTSALYLYSGDGSMSLPTGLSFDFDKSKGKLTANCGAAAVGKEYDCILHFLPGDNEIPFTLRCENDISVSSDLSEIYVGQKAKMAVGGAVGDYSVSCDTPSVLKLSSSDEDAYLGQTERKIGESSFIYAWNNTSYGSGNRENRSDYDVLNLVFAPVDTLNDIKFVKSFPVLLPGIRENTEDVHLTIDGLGKDGPVKYVKLDEDGSPLAYDDFDSDLFAKTIAPSAQLVRNDFQLHPKSSAVLSEKEGLIWYSGTAEGFGTEELSCGLVDVGLDAVVTLPEKYYGSMKPFKSRLLFAIPKISDRWKKQTDTTLFYDSVVAADAITNSLETFNRFGNQVDFKKSGPNSSGIKLSELSGGLEWFFKDSGLSVSSLNSSPYGKQGATFAVTNVRDGSVWSKTLNFLLYHKFTINVYAYFAVEDRTVPDGYTSRFNESGVFLMTPRHWRLMQDIWLNSKNYWKKSSVSMGDISAAGVSLSKYVYLETSWMDRSDCYHEGDENHRYWQTNATYYNFEQGFLYVSNIGRDDIWGWKESGSSRYRYQYYYGEYFNEKNVKSINPIYYASYYDGYSILSYDEYIMRLGNEYVVINDKSGKVFKNTYTLWLGERSR